MGTKIHSKSYFPGNYSMNNHNEQSNGSNWPLFYASTPLTNGRYFNGFVPRNQIDAYPENGKDLLKRKMLEHEAIFKNQVFELHRLYGIQRDLMKEIEMKEPGENRSSSSFLDYQMPLEDARKWHLPNSPFTNSAYPEVSISPLSSTIEKNKRFSRISSQNEPISKNCVRKRGFDLQLPAEEYIDVEESEHLEENRFSSENCQNFVLGGDDSNFKSCLRKSTIGLADLNEPVSQAEEEPVAINQVNFLNLSDKLKPNILNLAHENSFKARDGVDNGASIKQTTEKKSYKREWLPYVYEGGHCKNKPSSISQALQQDKSLISFHPNQVMLNRNRQPPGALEISDRKRDFRSKYSSIIPGSIDFDHRNCNYINGPNFMELNSVSVSSENDVEIIGERRKDEGFVTALPWLRRAKAGFNNENTDFNRSLDRNECDVGMKKNIENEGKKRRVIDINIACDLIAQEESDLDAKVSGFRNQFDLNLCLTEDEDPCLSVKIAVEIDLEAPALPESEEDFGPGPEPEPDEDTFKIAAEALFFISSSSHENRTEENGFNPFEDSLLWFSEIVSSCGGDLDVDVLEKSKVEKGRFVKHRNLDYFEAMTLETPDMREEEYMPKPLVPEIGGNFGAGRARKGPPRRRRDFQRDILPGLVSLSRNEVTEDLQAFGGLMRATGHAWNVGPARRNCGGGAAARGRRRVVAETTTAATSPASFTPLMERLEAADMSLTGWGKVTKRPRRQQRCPAGNLLPIILT